MNIYFSGIGGIGISSLAQFYLKKGDNVSGSDLGENFVVNMLKEKGVNIYLKQKEQNITSNIDVFVYSEAIPENNPERLKAKKLNIKTYSYFELLGEISRNFKTIAVAGTHGKTTTTGFVASGLIETKKDPTVIVGTIIDIFDKTNFRKGGSDILVVEACEYRDNFRFIQPDIVLLTNLDHDHIDAFPKEKDYLKVFREFIKKSKVVVFHEDDEKVIDILNDFEGIKVPVKIPRNLELQMIGGFNKRNASLALGLCDFLKFDTQVFAKGLYKFKGASRRQEFIGEKNGVLFYDDYAHHPVELKKLHKGFKEKFRGKKVGIIFEPHQHSRTKELFKGFCETFAKIDFLGIMPIYAARDTEEDKKFTINNFLEKNANWKKVKNKKDLENFLQSFKKDDVVVFCGAGDISKFARDFVNN